jgi:hypothetical protein
MTDKPNPFATTTTFDAPSSRPGPKPRSSKSNIRLNVPLPPDLYEQLKQDAEANLRTPPAQALFLLMKHYGDSAD